MARSITPATSVENLRKDAKRWLKAIRAGDAAARARYERVRPAAPPDPGLRDVQHAIALEHAQESWESLTRACDGGARAVPPHVVEDRTIAPRRRLRADEWDDLIAVVKEQRLTGVSGDGLITDEVLARIAGLDDVTALDLGGSRALSDDGLQHLARMPQLESLNLNEYPGGTLTDRALDVLRHLPNLRRFEMTWQRGITDAGAANLRFCDALEQVDLMGTFTGDGAIEALQGKTKLHSVSTGRLVTDAGLRLLQQIPLLKTRAVAPDAHLLIDGPFTDAGLASLRGLDGVVDLDLFWHATAITSDGFAHLADLPNVESLGADGELATDVSLRHIAAMPRLRKLRIQSAVAGDDGFEALSHRPTLEALWGRQCPNFGSRGFLALSTMPALRSMGIGLDRVGDDALPALARFPALRDLTPIGLDDESFRHVGRCDGLERLSCMYCRASGDAATAHVAGLLLKTYYAGLTQITDRSLDILGRMASLEDIELYECTGVTDAGLGFLAGLPNLRRVKLSRLPHVTYEGTRVFPARVHVKYSI